MTNKGALALISDIDKSKYNEGTYYQVAPLMFQKINEKIDNKNGAQKTLLLYLIFQEQNGTFHPSEASILKACGFVHSSYVEARKGLAAKGLIEYVPFKHIKINYQNIMS